MSDQKTLATWNQATELLAANAEDEIKETARKLMKLAPGGNHLTADQAVDLAVYSFMTGLNPFNNECYYMDKVGPTPGIAGYRVKAMNWLVATSDPREFGSAPRIWEEYRKADPGEADFDPDEGDIAWVCSLYDTFSRDTWQVKRIELMQKYKDMGATFQEAHELATKDIGECPHWEAVGVVHADEHFSGNIWENNIKNPDKYKPEMWDRNERAKKRAAKGCYRKGFPQMNIPDAEYGEFVTANAEELKVKIIDEVVTNEKERQEELTRKSEAQLMNELGFGSPPEEQSQPASNLEITEAIPNQTTPIAEATELTYTGTIAKIGKHSYPAQWARLVAAYTRCNQFEADGILQKLHLAQDTKPENVIDALNEYLSAKDALQPS